ncbi:hypothetical protein [Ruminococcus albus]|uniref:Uncharacterized protein n=1 Tax=Ruminococcus albus 8 TaxID=246199 RepID=E9SCI8_RUMAL|nr:hypothetical protein [Ruminococcus albus]EGC03024.1 hypothetical protein CUS_5901 [Ruminococcus albus 8]
MTSDGTHTLAINGTAADIHITRVSTGEYYIEKVILTILRMGA